MGIGSKRREVGLLSFNSDGSLLIALSQDFEHHISVFDWRRETKIRDAEGGGEGVECLRFNPYSQSAFASCGKKHLKFWELGDAEAEVAVGLFGDLGEPTDQFVMAFHPRGITLSGNELGEIYAWSNGVVSAKYERAHKGKVIGLLFVDGVALFSAGTGGILKMWDPELKNTTTPLGIVDLKSFQPKGSPALLQKLSGRSMDWTTDAALMQDINDDNPVKDDPARGVCGAPATHLSFADLRSDGILLIGTTCNAVLALGIKRVQDWAHHGVPESHHLEGYSANSIEGTLKDQDWWDTPDVNQYKGKYGATPGHLPVAVYWYQGFDAAAPGFRRREPSGRLGSCPWKLAVCGKKVIGNNHFGAVDTVMPMPNERLFVSASADYTARLWDINDQTMIDSFDTRQGVKCAAWWSRNTPDGPDGEETIKGKQHPVLALGHTNGSVSVWRCERSASDAADQDDDADAAPFFDPEDAFGQITLCCIMPLPRVIPASGTAIYCLKYSSDGKYLAVGTGDNCIDIYRHSVVMIMDRPLGDQMREKSKQKALGLSDEEINSQDCFPYKRVGCFNDHSSNVLGLDFSADGTVFRTVSASNELLFGMMPNGKLNTATQECSTKKFASHTCKFGWTIKSIWAKGSNADDINAVDVSHAKVPPWAPCFGGNHPAPYPMPAGYISAGSFDPSDVKRVRNFPGEGTATSWGHQVTVTAQDDGKVKVGEIILRCGSDLVT